MAKLDISIIIAEHKGFTCHLIASEESLKGRYWVSIS